MPRPTFTVPSLASSIPSSAPRRPSPEVPVGLASLGGKPAPRDLVLDLAKLGAMPGAAKEHLWELLGPCLGEVSPPDLAARVERFCSAYSADGASLGDAVGAARHLLRAASAADLSRAEFADDLSRIPGEHGLDPLLVPGFDAAKALVRAEIARASVTDHGKALTGVDWRIDTVASSSRGSQIGAQVVMLTLRYQRGDRRGQVTLQASTEAVRELRAICDRILG
jgi:hypothetical protein